jgi:uncharacterized protein (TIGR02246 family)
MSTTDQNPAANDETAIRALIARWSKAVRDEDLAGIGADHDPEILMFDVPPPLLGRGFDAYMESWKTFFDWSTRPIVFDFHDLEIVAGPEVAFAAAIGRCCGRELNGNATRLEFRLTMGFRKRHGSWCIVHEHHSVPATD